MVMGRWKTVVLALYSAVCSLPLCTLCSHGASARDQAWRAKTRKQLEPDTEPRARIQATAPGCPLLGRLHEDSSY